jgi:DNA primase
MGRIAEAEIERLKKEISVERLAEAKGVKLAAHGKDRLGRCPFHDDRTPSLVITPGANLWHCLGACQAGGSSIDWVMRAEGVSFRKAVELLRADSPSLGEPLPPVQGRQQGPVPKESTTMKLPVIGERSGDDEALLRDVVGFYHATLKESPEALAYLAKRGLQNLELVERFQLGFANRTLAYRLPSKDREAGATLRARLQGVGILRASGHEHLTGSLVVPVIAEDGRVTEMYGRKITPGLRPGTPLHLYLAGPHRGVWNLEAVAASKEIILCESLLDAMTFWCAGFRNVTASYGVEGFTADHLEAFRRHGTERVRIAYDRDEAGDRAAEKLATTLTAEGIECFRVQFPKGMDANEYALKMAPAPKALELVLRHAQWMGTGPRPTVTVVSATSTVVADADGVVLDEIDASEPPTESEQDNTPPRRRDQQLKGVGRRCAAPRKVAAVNVPSPNASDDDEVTVRLGDRQWRVRGLSKNTRLEALKVNVRVLRDGSGFHVDTIELYSARQRAAYVSLAAIELGVEEQVVKRDLGELLLKLEELHEAKLRLPKETATRRELTEDEQRAALELLRDPKLLERIADDIERCGVVGERTNALVGYLAATSRKLDRPLAVVIQSSSAAGKSSLMDAVLELMPEEERTQYSAMTGQSLFYLGESDLRHRILAIVEEEGAERAAYALKLLQSEGELTIASTGKDPATGRLVTQAYRVEGPVMIFLTTTAMEVDEELLNRCLVLSVDEGREQTRAIHARQRTAETLGGMLAKRARERVVKLHRDAQRMLRPLVVVNPFAEELGFLDHATRTRRDHMKYLILIRTIALLHQHQRPMKTVQEGADVLSYIEVTREDIAVANRLCHEVLGRTLDELPPQTRRLLGLVEVLVQDGCTRQGVVREDFRFTRREVREATQWGNTQLKVHLGRLLEMEYLAVHRGKQGQGYVYELAYDGGGKDGSPSVSGLLDGSAAPATTGTSRGSGGDIAGPGRPSVGPESGGGRRAPSSLSADESQAIASRERREVRLRAVGG